MISRRQLRIKALQSLYAYYTTGREDMRRSEKELHFNIEKAYELYHYLFLLLIDVIIYAERPKLGEFKDEMRRKLSRLLCVSPERAGIKGKTYEGLGPIGEGLAIAAHALVLVEETGE